MSDASVYHIYNKKPFLSITHCLQLAKLKCSLKKFIEKKVNFASLLKFLFFIFLVQSQPGLFITISYKEKTSMNKLNPNYFEVKYSLYY